ncbi:hypothetical protein VYU27_006153 [Nannochloropsis oceanica]
MSRMQVATFSGCKVYNLSAGKSVPQWLSEKQRRQLSKENDYRRRVELIQDLEFPTASQRLRVSPDGQYIVASGTYPPAVRVYEVQEMSMKFERRLTAEVVDFLILSEDVGKLCFLQNDRTISFHAPYGSHYSMRIPTFGRSLAYHPPSCDLYVAAAGPDIYRLNLEEGRFRAPVASSSTSGVNVLALNPVHFLLGAGGEEGGVELIDPRTRKGLSVLDIPTALAGAGYREAVRGGLAVTALEFDGDGLSMVVGSSSGHVLLYDLRSSMPLCVKEHQYGLPIVAVKFHHMARQILSADSKLLKVWGRDGLQLRGGAEEGGREGGAVLTNIETPAAINDVCIVPDVGGGREGGRKDSGLLLLAGEQERVMTYYAPALGPAPRWCSFLDSITEELEEGGGEGGGEGGVGGGGGGTVYDDYKFVTRQEVEELNASNLIGTPLLRGYMHGFFMDAALYAKLQAVSQPAAFEEWRKAKVKERLDAKRTSRISFQKELPTVNRALAERLLKMGNKKKREEGRQEEEGGKAGGKNPLGDDRFASLFTRTDFQVDEQSAEFKLRNPNGVTAFPGGRKTRRGRREGSDEEGSDDDLAVVQSHFREVEEEKEDESEGGEESGDSDENEVDTRPESLGGKTKTTKQLFKKMTKEQYRKEQRHKTVAAAKKGRKPRFMEAEAVEEDGRAMLFHDRDRKVGARSRLEQKRLPLSERVETTTMTKTGVGGGREGKVMLGSKRGQLQKLRAHEGGFVREMTYNPDERRKEKRAN